MAPEEYSISILDPFDTSRLVEDISSLLCVDRPEFAPLFGKDHRRRMEEDFRMEEVRRERKAKEDKTGEQNIKRGLLTAVAATSSGELVAHACIISSPGQVRLFIPTTLSGFFKSYSFQSLHYPLPKVILLIFFFQRLGFWRTCLLTHPIGGKVGSFEKSKDRVVHTLRNVLH